MIDPWRDNERVDIDWRRGIRFDPSGAEFCLSVRMCCFRQFFREYADFFVRVPQVLNETNPRNHESLLRIILFHLKS